MPKFSVHFYSAPGKPVQYVSRAGVRILWDWGRFYFKLFIFRIALLPQRLSLRTNAEYSCRKRWFLLQRGYREMARGGKGRGEFPRDEQGMVLRTSTRLWAWEVWVYSGLPSAVKKRKGGKKMDEILKRKIFSKFPFNPSKNICCPWFINLCSFSGYLPSFKAKSRSKKASVFKATCSACRLSKWNLPPHTRGGVWFHPGCPSCGLAAERRSGPAWVCRSVPRLMSDTAIKPQPLRDPARGFSDKPEAHSGLWKSFIPHHMLGTAWRNDVFLVQQQAPGSFIPWAFIWTFSQGYLQTPGSPFSPRQLPWGPSTPKDDVNPRTGW